MRATAFRALVPIDRAELAELVVGGEHHQISEAGSPFPRSIIRACRRRARLGQRQRRLGVE